MGNVCIVHMCRPITLLCQKHKNKKIIEKSTVRLLGEKSIKGTQSPLINSIAFFLFPFFSIISFSCIYYAHKTFCFNFAITYIT